MPLKSAKVRDYMSGKLIAFTPDTDIMDAVKILVENRITGAPVVDNHGELVGMLSEFDCLKVVLEAGYHDHPGGPVSELMTRDVQTIDANTSVFDLTQMFLDSGFRRYPVIDNNELVGQISRKDLLRALLDLAR